MMACREIEREAVTQHSDLRERERELRDTTLNNMHHLRLQRLSLLAAASRGCWRAERGCVYVGKGGRERRPAGQERETAESERERALRFELCVERHPGVGGDSNDCERRTNQHSSAYGAAGVPREIVCVGGERTEREGWVAGRE